MAKLPSLTVQKLTSKTNSSTCIARFCPASKCIAPFAFETNEILKYLSRKEQQSCSVALNRSNSLLPIFSLSDE